MKNYYQILGVDDDADLKAIKTAYRRLARKYHPDISKEDQAEEKFKEVAEAYEVLGNKDKRAEYDEMRRFGDAQEICGAIHYLLTDASRFVTGQVLHIDGGFGIYSGV